MKNNKVLFIYNDYREYSDKIIRLLKQFSFELTCFSLTPKMNKLELLFNDFYNDKYFQKKTETMEYNFISNFNHFDYDYVFVLTGRRLKYEVLEVLKAKCKKAKFILYLWDDIARVDGMLEKIHFFDKVYSFDSNDCKKYDFDFLPLFYSPEFTQFNLNKIYDLFYCGVAHQGRYELLKQLSYFSLVNNLNLNAYLLINLGGYLRRYLFNPEFRRLSKFIFCNSLSLNDFAKNLCASKVCVDMQISSQTGLTMRCIESLPAQTKIITTNEHIKEYDFYCPENVMIIDRENPVFDVDFIKSPYKPIPKEIVEKYSLENWIKTIIFD